MSIIILNKNVNTNTDTMVLGNFDYDFGLVYKLYKCNVENIMKEILTIGIIIGIGIGF